MEFITVHDHAYSSTAVGMYNKEHVRRWLKLHHATKRDVWLQLYKKHVGRVFCIRMPWKRRCVSDGSTTLRRIDDRRHMLRFTPRRPDSVWAPSNIARMKRLVQEHKMTPAGLKVFRSANWSSRPTGFLGRAIAATAADLERALLKRTIAWKHWQNRPPSARRIAICG